MRFHWVVSILSALVSMGLLVIITGQYQVLSMLSQRAETLVKQSKRLGDQQANEDLFKATLDKLLVQGGKVVEDLEATVTKFSPEVEKKKTENDACQAEKKTNVDQLAGVEKERSNTEAELKVEYDAWQQETATLEAQLTGYRPVCDHVKANALAAKLCGIKPSSTPEKDQNTP